MTSIIKESVTWVTIDESTAGQRIDNFLLKTLKGVPKSHIYRMLRSGEVRANSRRVDAMYRLASGDRVRIPPVRVAEKPAAPRLPATRLMTRVLHCDEHLLAIDKPAGQAVHGGSGISLGVIEQLRLENPDWHFLELVHRLDRETSGVLLLARKRSALVAMHAALREGRVEKHYLALATGHWRDERRHVRAPLTRYLLPNNERRVRVDPAGQSAHTLFTRLESFAGCALLDAELMTGRTHQIRVHLAHLGHAIAGDPKYAPETDCRAYAARGLRRMFLHAAHLELVHPATGEQLRIDAPLPLELDAFLNQLRTEI